MKNFTTSYIIALLALTATRASAVEIAFEEDHSLPLVYVNVAVQEGNVTDPTGQSGITNFVSEMLLRGSKSRTKEEIDLELDQIGARLEVETRAEAVILRGAVLSTQLEPFLKLVSDLISEPSFPENEIRKLKSETISGILEELGRDASLANRKFVEFLFHGHPYGKPVLGKVKDIEKLTREQILAHYDRLFRDRKLLIVGAGDTTETRIHEWANALSEARPGGNPPVLVSETQDSPQRRLEIVDKPDRTQTQIYGGQIGVRMTDPAFFPLYVGNHAFGGGSFSARLMSEIRVKRGWSYGAGSNFRQGKRPRSWTFHLFPAEKDTPQALALTLKMIEQVRDQGITLEEYTFARTSLINSSGFMFNTPQKRVENKLLERTLDLPNGFMKSYASEIQKVSLDQVNAALRTFIKPESLAITVLGTAKNLKDPLTQSSGVESSQVEVVPYTQE